MRPTTGTARGAARAAAAALAAAALGFTGCGSDDEDAGAAAQPAQIPAAIGEKLAGRADEVTALLEAGDLCGAARKADELANEVEKARDRIPVELRAELAAGTAQLVNTVNCPPPILEQQPEKAPKPEKAPLTEGFGEDEGDSDEGNGSKGDGGFEEGGPGNSENAPGRNDRDGNDKGQGNGGGDV